MAEEAYQRGQFRAIEKIPIGVKDNIDVIGFPTTGGTSALIGHMP